MKLIPVIGSSRKNYTLRFGLFVSVMVLLMSFSTVNRTFAATAYTLEDDLMEDDFDDDFDFSDDEILDGDAK